MTRVDADDVISLYINEVIEGRECNVESFLSGPAGRVHPAGQGEHVPRGGAHPGGRLGHDVVVVFEDRSVVVRLYSNVAALARRGCDGLRGVRVGGAGSC